MKNNKNIFKIIYEIIEYYNYYDLILDMDLENNENIDNNENILLNENCLIYNMMIEDMMIF